MYSDQQYMATILKRIKQFNKIVIHRHINPDPDAIGSQVGLGELIQSSFPEKMVKYAGKGTQKLNFLHTFTSVEADDYEGALVIVTDTANIARIDGEYYHRGVELIKIDHHPQDDQYGTIQWINTSASSTSEMIAAFWQMYQDELTLSNRGAQLLYMGIVGDTGRFQYSNTTPNTLRLSASLLAMGFDHTRLLNQLYEMSPEVAQLNGYALSETVVSSEGVGYLVISQKDLEQLRLIDEDTNAIVSTPGVIQGIKCWGVFVEQPDGSYRCRLRSHGPVINRIAKEHDGGGHPLASGANAENLDEVMSIVEKFKHAVIQWELDCKRNP